LDNTSNNQNY